MKTGLADLLTASGERPKILVVDDQAVNIRLVGELFKSDCEVFMAMDGEQALAQCDAVLPDLILLDLIMPGMDGHEVCARLKANVNTRDIPVIFLSAQREESDEAYGFELGAVDYVTKPFNQTILRARVRTHLMLKRQADQLKSFALVDGLTGVANRRRFDEDLGSHWLQCVRDQAPLSLIMMDVDYFKRYNDHYGHQMGDECLRQIVQAAKQSLRRPHDLFARYGGEEFVCLLPRTDASGACELAGQMMARIRALNIPHAQSEVDQIVTVSIGVATGRPYQNIDPQSLLKLADQQLYESKQSGRARISACVAE